MMARRPCAYQRPLAATRAGIRRGAHELHQLADGLASAMRRALVRDPSTASAARSVGFRRTPMASRSRCGASMGMSV